MSRWNVLCVLVILASACDCEDTREVPDGGFVLGEGDMAPDSAGADQGADQGVDQGIDQGIDQGVDMMTSAGSRCFDYVECQGGEARQVDVLWVIDNSATMCEEQAALLERFDRFLEGIDPRTDMQIGVTTTHVPLSPYPLEPVARAGQLQSMPQPVPGFGPSCSGERSDGFAPLRRQLAQAVRCMQTPDEALNQWTDDEIACARESRAVCGRVTDRDGDGRLTDADLFPRLDEYRPLPKVLKAEDYRLNVQLDVERLRADFACMALVGTRGTGYEKGLQAAILAVSPELTAPGAPNEGFLRPGAETAVVFLSDENDCSNNGQVQESGGTCGAESCDYWNSPALAAMSPLLKPAEFKRELLGALSASKGRAVGEGEVFVATLVGGWAPYEGDQYPVCRGMDKPAVPFSCVTPDLGEARSGDRYQRAARQFARYYPDEASRGDQLNFNKRDEGALCEGELAPALADIGERVGRCRREVACP